MTLKELTTKYIQNTERVFAEMKIIQGSKTINDTEIISVIEMAKDYFEDAKYYRELKKLETSLTSVAYCEGLLDALRLLGIVEFFWGERK